MEGIVYDSQTALPNIHRLLNDGKICVLGNEKVIFINAKGDGSISFYTSHRAEESWHQTSGIDFSDRNQVFAWFKKEFSAWDPMWDGLFEKASSHFIPRPQYCVPFDQTWEALPNLTLLGDAAHVMPPFAGEGVNMAMLDALELAECLLNDDFPDLHAAIAVYEKQMRERTSETAKITMQMTQAFHSPDSIGFLKRFFNK